MKGKLDKKEPDDNSLRQALIKKALGYDATEIVEEYVTGDEGQVVLSKKKVTKKNVPPDLSAIKMLIDGERPDIFGMSDEELEQERQRLILMVEKNLIKKEKKSERKK